MDYLGDYIRCASFIFFLSFKPSEPHLSRYLKEVKHLTRDEVNNDVYPVYTYMSLMMVVSLAVLKLAGYVGLRSLNFSNDKFFILFGCAGRVATRLILLFGESLWMMQVMQATFALGMAAEIVFYAYCLKVVPAQHTQRLTALTQASYLVSHTCAGVMGDWLLSVGMSLLDLMWISGCSVMVAALIALTFRNVDANLHNQVRKSTPVLSSVYKTRRFWLSAMWWALNYPIYMTIYGYEPSLYAENVAGADYNGTTYAIGLLSGSACSLLLSIRAIECMTARIAPFVFIALGMVMATATGFMGWYPSDPWALGISFTAFFMAWSFANTLFYGETRRVVDNAILQPRMSILLGIGDTDAQDAESEAMRLVSVVFVMNSAAGNLANGALTAVLFTWLQLDVDAVFHCMAIAQWTVAASILGLVMVLCKLSASGVDNTGEVTLPALS